MYVALLKSLVMGWVERLERPMEPGLASVCGAEWQEDSGGVVSGQPWSSCGLLISHVTLLAVHPPVTSPNCCFLIMLGPSL